MAKGCVWRGTILHLTRATRADTSIILHAVIPNAQQVLSSLSSADKTVCPTATEMIKVTAVPEVALNSLVAFP